MFAIIKKVYALFSPRNKRNALILLACMTISAVLEMVGVALIFPFIALLSNPSYIHSHIIFSDIKNLLHLSSAHQLMLVVGSLMLFTIFIGNTFSAYTMWKVLRFSNLQEYELSRRLLQSYLSRPYSFFITKNPADLGKNTLSEVSAVVSQVIIPGMQMFSKIISVLVLFALLIFVNVMLSVIISLCFIVTYAGIYLFLKHKLDHVGRESVDANNKKFRYIYEAFNAIKDLKLLGATDYAVRQYSAPAERHALSNAVGNTIANLPRFFFEIVVFGGLILFILIMLSMHKDLSDILPVLATYAFAGMRLMPATQFVYTSVSLIRFGTASLNHLYNEFFNTDDAPFSLDVMVETPLNIMRLREKIELHNCTYAYASKSPPVISALSLTFDFKKCTGIVGVSGAGKTTIADILLGLLVPQEGVLTVDNVTIDAHNLSSWQSIIGYVPQRIYLIDSTVIKNIAFGIDDEKIDLDKVKWASKMAGADDFIENDLALGYDTIVGDKGISLSGGQCQRVGIARALYRDPQFLVLDEATSALDNVLEKKILHNIAALEKTIVMITHRLSTVSNCDKLYVLEKNGKVVGEGGYDYLKNHCRTFQNLLAAEEAVDHA